MYFVDLRANILSTLLDLTLESKSDVGSRLLFELNDGQALKGKNVLNRFRQSNGYKDGSYQKYWNGKEDNVHLAELILELDPYDTEFLSKLYNQLDYRYRELNAEAKRPSA